MTEKLCYSHEYLSELEPLGWIHTQPNELPQLSPQVRKMIFKIWFFNYRASPRTSAPTPMSWQSTVPGTGRRLSSSLAGEITLFIKWHTVKKRLAIKITFWFQLHPWLVLVDSIQADTVWIRMGPYQHRQEQQPQGLPPLPLWEGPDAPLRSLPWLLHGPHPGEHS